MTAAAEMTIAQQKDGKITDWFAQYGKRLLRFVRSKIRDWEEAEDLTQEVWYQLARQEDVEAIEQIGAWLFTAAGNRVMNYYKKKKAVPFSQLKAQSIDFEEDEAGNLLDSGLFFNQWIEQRLPDELLESQEFWDELRRVLDTLPAEQREVFVENELNDVTFREMSERSGISINTLMARKRYAVLSLRRAFVGWV